MILSQHSFVDASKYYLALIIAEQKCYHTFSFLFQTRNKFSWKQFMLCVQTFDVWFPKTFLSKIIWEWISLFLTQTEPCTSPLRLKVNIINLITCHVTTFAASMVYKMRKVWMFLIFQHQKSWLVYKMSTVSSSYQ